MNITYPPELHEELVDYPLDFLGLNLFTRTPEQMYADFLKGQAARHRVALDWIESGNYDFMWMVFTGPDKVQHFFWKYMDPDHPSHDPAKAEALSGKILELWKKQDQILGELLAALPADATVMMLSDHGFDGIYRQVNLANWLARTDLVEWQKHHAIPPLMITNGILHYILEGELAGASDREAFLDKFVDLCGTLRDPETGANPIENMFRREEIYSGRMMEKAPDLVFQEIPKYFVTRGVPDSLDLPAFQDVWTTSFSAHHRPEGILAIRSPSVHANTSGSLRDRIESGGDFQSAHIMDVTPTLLAILGEIIPDEMDGRVLEETFDPEFLRSNPWRVEAVEGFLLDRAPPSELTPEEREKYKAIPYIN